MAGCTRVGVLENPVNSYFPKGPRPDARVDANKLFFPSAPVKGLADAVRVFKILLRSRKDLQLHFTTYFSKWATTSHAEIKTELGFPEEQHGNVVARGGVRLRRV